MANYALICTNTQSPVQAAWTQIGTAAANDATAFATAAQGAVADSALQPAGNGSGLSGITKAQVGLGNVDNTADSAKPVSTAAQTALNLKANLNGATFTGSMSSTVSMGYAAGAGGAVVQATSKSTGVTLNKICGRITTHNAALAAAAEVTFVVTNSTVAATDVPVVSQASGGTAGAYAIVVSAVAAGSFSVSISNLSAGSLSQAIVINFVVIKSVVA